MNTPPAVQQISLSLSREHNAIVPATAACLARQRQDLKTVREIMVRENEGGITFDLHERLPPFNICITETFSNQVRRLHRLLDKVLIDVVDRWFTDENANFPGRMPLEKHEEELLKWIGGAGREVMPSFRDSYGMWRTDYVLERNAEGREQAKIIEINSRIPYNGFWVVGLHEEATRLLGAGGEYVFKSPNDFNVSSSHLHTESFLLMGPRRRATRFSVVSTPVMTLYHICDKWPGVDSHSFARELERRTGRRVVWTKPSQLRLQANSKSHTGYSLFYCPEQSANGVIYSVGSGMQEIQQCSLELFQEEYSEMDPVLLRQLATCCVNDFRNIFLVHDKRILGIVLEELHNLEARRVLTPEERLELERGIAPTLLPGTGPVKELLRQSKTDQTQRARYIIKPVRDAGGAGIRLGSHLAPMDWIELLQRQAGQALRPNEEACVIQELAHHIWYDIVRHERESTEPEKFHLIGSHHLIQSRLDVFGPWRIGEDTHVGFQGERKGIVMSCVLRPEGISDFHGKDG